MAIPYQRGASSRAKFTFAAIVAVALVGLAALVIVVGSPPARQTSTTEPSTTSTASSGSSGSSTLGLLMSVSPTERLIAAGIPGNFTLTLFKVGSGPELLTLAASAPPGISVLLSPSLVILSGETQAIDLRVKSDLTAPPGSYSVTLKANGASGAFSETFQFQLLSYLVQIVQGSGGWLPSNLTVKVGGTVTWYNLDVGSDENTGLHIVSFRTLNLSSPTLQLHDTWKHTFDTPGAYIYYDPLTGLEGRVYVVA